MKMKGVVQILLIPLSWIYSAVVRLRNFLYDHNILKSRESSLPSICVGNIAVGGTGKTPHSEHILRTVEGRKAYVSRGYRRKSRGMVVADEHSTAEDLGDEAYQIHRKFPDVTVVVDANRHRAVDYLKSRGDVDIVVLDDAFQHRDIRATHYIIITDFATNLKTERMLPAGRLRDERRSLRRADCIVVSKTPEDVTESEMEQKRREVLQGELDVKVVFTRIVYGEAYNAVSLQPVDLKARRLCLFTGIEKPEPLQRYLAGLTSDLKCLRFADHHEFTATDYQRILAAECDLFVTTEKDFARIPAEKLQLFAGRLAIVPIKISRIS